VGASHPLDFDRRLRAVATFRSHPDAAGLAAANKRIRNILRKNKSNENQTVNADLLSDPAEIALFSALTETATAIKPDIEKGDFQAALRFLAGLRATVDQFFDDVMVLADDSDIRANRLALVNNMHQLFLGIADISLLQDQEPTHD
ncbi:MAG: DALR anticodon-binding domain-containing protein, partial [Pseudomonadota bacterium]